METICGIIAACLPTIRPVLKDMFVKTSSILSYFSGKSRLESFSNPGYPLPEIAPMSLNGFDSTTYLRKTVDVDINTRNDVEDEGFRSQRAAFV